MATINSLQKGLIFHAPLDGEHLAKDVTPYGNDGTITGATLSTGVKGEENGSYSFDGNDKITFQQSGLQTLSISFWCKPNSTQVSYTNILSFYNTLKIEQSGDNTNVYILRDGLGSFTAHMTLNTDWNYITIVKDSDAGNIKLYKNNVLQETDTAGDLTYTDAVLYLGSWGNSQRYWNGSIAETRIYNRVLSADEIKLLYDSYKPRISTSSLEKGLVGHWMLDSASEKLGSELIINGGFDIDNYWSKSTGWSISDGISKCDGTQTSYSSLKQDINVVVGKRYSLTFTIKNYSAGFMLPWMGNLGMGTLRNANGTYTEIIVGNGSVELLLEANLDFVGEIDDVSVKEVKVADLSGYGNDGTGAGGVTIGGGSDRKGLSGGATNFDGTDDSVVATSTTEITDFSLSWWQTCKNVAKERHPIGFSTSQMQIYMLSSSTQLSTLINGISVRTGIEDTVDTWYHYSLTNNSGGRKLYRNGVLVNSNVTPITGLDTSSIYIGNRFSGSAPTYNYNGSLSDVRIYDRALSPEEISLLYSQYKPKGSANVGSLNKGLVSDMPLTTKHMKSATVVADRTPYNNFGTVYGATVGSDSTSFDGTDDYIDCGNINQYSETVSLWFKPNSIINKDTPSMSLINLRDYDTGYHMITLGASTSYFSSEILTVVYRNSTQYPRSAYTSTTDSISAEWHHLGVVRVDADENWHIYLDGERIDNDYNDLGQSAKRVSNLMWIGARNDDNRQYFDGDISGVKIYNRALSADEVKLLYDKGRY